MPESGMLTGPFVTAQVFPVFGWVRNVAPVAVTLMFPAKLLKRVMGTSAYALGRFRENESTARMKIGIQERGRKSFFAAR